MLKEFKTQELTLAGNFTQLQGIGFEDLDQHLTVKPGYMNLNLSNSAPEFHLSDVIFAKSGSGCQWRVGSIDSTLRVNELVMLLHWISQNQYPDVSPLRTSCIQLNLSDEEWDGIELQHYHLIERLASSKELFLMAHLNFPTDHFYQKIDQEKSIFQKKIINKLSRQINTKSWIQYSKWLNEEMRNIRRLISFDALDEYQLEASFKHFSHEVLSELLSSYQNEDDKLVLQLGANGLIGPAESPHLTPQQRLDIEKQLLELRFDIRDNLQRQHDLLAEIIVQIGAIVKGHPDLINLQNMCRLLRALLDTQIDLVGNPSLSWGMQLMLIGLLDAYLGVISIVNCSVDIERTNVAFAIKLAMVQLFNSHDHGQVVDLALHWDSVIPEINKRIIEMGYHHFVNWLKNGKEDQLFRQRAELAKQLRFFVLENLYSFCSKLRTSSAPLDANEVIFFEYLNFFPFHIKTAHDSFDLLVYDSESGEPKKLTQKGLSFLSKCGITRLVMTM